MVMQAEQPDFNLFLYYTKDTAVTKNGLLEQLAELRTVFPHHVLAVDVSDSKFLTSQLSNTLPLLELGEVTLHTNFDRSSLTQFFRGAQNKQQLEGGKAAAQSKIKPLDRKEKRSLFFQRCYPLIVILILSVYIGLAFLAPVLMSANQTETAQKLYALYQAFCHQMATRSFFLFGRQFVYPARLAGMKGLQTFSEATKLPETEISVLKQFVGNQSLGYKVALCQRDLAIYTSILIVSLLFLRLRYTGKNIHWLVWLFLGLVPIVFDGSTQLISGLGLPVFSWIPARESTPWLRVITGLLFGGLTAWYGLFTTEEIFLEKRLDLEKRSLAWKVFQA